MKKVSDLALLERLSRNMFTEAHVEKLFLQCRDHGYGRLVKEFGDFVAHNHREKGLHLDRLDQATAQFAGFLATSSGPYSINAVGECPWWLKPLLLSRLEALTNDQLRNDFRATRQEAKAAIDGIFPSKDRWPTKVSVGIKEQHLIAAILSSSAAIDVRPAHSASEVRASVEQIARRNNLPATIVDTLIVGMAIALARTTASLVDGAELRAVLCVPTPRRLDLGPADIPGARWSIGLGHGLLAVNYNVHGFNKQPGVVSFPFIETDVDTEGIFDQNLLQIDEYGQRTLDLSRPLVLESQRAPMVFAIS